ncbi:MAG: hypothetical protein HC893_10485 [Chloroflexaceae bacterium]|nr:hypothetical protein [Chloroflexaceae bacterium]NJL34201.1 hypothetical protein [Chloroflexaceae bacterium]NJO07646.1 hypothetical protein [Chloroflexaceae bacterium]
MLQQVLHEIEQAREPLSLNDLARRLEIDPGTLDGMLTFWVRKGRIVVRDGDESTCTTGSGCGSCASTVGCPFAGKAPRTFMLKGEEPRH